MYRVCRMIRERRLRLMLRVWTQSGRSVEQSSWCVPLTLLEYRIERSVGGLVDSLETVPVCFAALLLCLTLRPAGILYFFLCPLLVIIYCVVLKNVAVNVVAVGVHWFSDVSILRVRMLYTAQYMWVCRLYVALLVSSASYFGDPIADLLYSVVLTLYSSLAELNCTQSTGCKLNLQLTFFSVEVKDTVT